MNSVVKIAAKRSTAFLRANQSLDGAFVKIFKSLSVFSLLDLLHNLCKLIREAKEIIEPGPSSARAAQDRICRHHCFLITNKFFV